MATIISKDPNATLDFIMNWRPTDTPWLQVGESISASVWTVPAGLTLDSSSFDANSATAFISGGVLGTRYEIANQITTDAGRIDERSFYIAVQNQFV